MRYFVDNCHPGDIYRVAADKADAAMATLVNEGGDPVEITAERVQELVGTFFGGPDGDPWLVRNCPAWWSGE